MYKSGVMASDLIKSVRSEADVSVSLPDSLFYRSLSAVEQFLYTEVIDEYIAVRVKYSGLADGAISLSDVSVPAGCAAAEFDDILRVFADSAELEKSGAVGAWEFPEKNLYYTDYDGSIRFVLQEMPDEIVLMVRLRPELKSEDSDSIVALPPEFIDLAEAKLRGDAYRVSNEDGLAAKWLAEYNNRLETFKVWSVKRNERFGG